MSASKLVDGRFLKWFVIINALVPALILAWDGYHGQLGVNGINFLIRSTGMLGLVFLVLSLLITPVRRLTGWSVLIAPRRQLGLYGFFYIAAHFMIFWLYDRAGDIADTFSEIIERPYLWFGFGALVLMIPLAITSLDSMVTKLGPKRWKLLHRLTYLIVPAGVVHYYLLVKSDVRQPTVFGVVVGVALLSRLIPTRKKKPAAKKKFWSGELVLAEIRCETHDVKTFRFKLPDGAPLPFEHVAGQYLNIALMIDGRRVNRSYTIASSPVHRDYVEISVKRDPKGVASQFLHDHVTEGMKFKIGAPAGKFYFAGTEAKRVVLVAGGVGITPMMSVIRTLTHRKWTGEMTLLFSVRKPEDVIFQAELDALRAAHPNLRCEYVVTSERGHITKAIVANVLPDLGGCRVMLCGPDPMMTAMRGLFVDLGVPDAHVTQEAFISPLQVVAGATPAETPLEGVAANISFQRTGISGEANDMTILEVAEECGVEIPYECRSGICGQCKTPLLSGKVTMDSQDALTASDRSKGLILACQARAATAELVVDA
jgi:ferredoxin-NADP reductase/DMSO/TMAO reductase YedYZ heme-binding membrane subunit